MRAGPSSGRRNGSRVRRSRTPCPGCSPGRTWTTCTSATPTRAATTSGSSARPDGGSLAAGRGALLRIDPRSHARLEHVERQRTRIEHGVVELPDVELRPELLLRPLPQLEDLQLPRLVRERLARDRDVSVRLGLDVHLVDRRVGVEVIDDLLP